MRFTKKTESSNELADELTSMLAQGVDRVVLLERDSDDSERTVNEWAVERAFATQAIARTVQKLVEREAPFGRLFMLRGYRAGAEVDRVLLDVGSERAELVGPGSFAQGSALASAPEGGGGGIGERMFAHVMQMNERLMLQLTGGTTLMATHFGHIIEAQNARLREVEAENARLHAEARSFREKNDDKELSALRETLNLDKVKMFMGTVQMLAPALLQRFFTKRDGVPDANIQQLGMTTLLASLTAEQRAHIASGLSQEQTAAFAMHYEAAMKQVDEAAKKTAATAEPASPFGSNAPPTAAPSAADNDADALAAARAGAASAPTMRVIDFLGALDFGPLRNILTVAQMEELTTLYVAAEISKPTYLARVRAWFDTTTDAQRASIGATLSPEHIALLAHVLQDFQEAASSDAKAPPTSGVVGAP